VLASGGEPLLSPVAWHCRGQLALESRPDPAFFAAEIDVPRPEPTYAHEIVISAVPYDTMLVAELTERLAPRLRTVPVWASRSPSEPSGAASTLLADASRIALVLHQRLWRHDAATQSDHAALGERLRDRPESVRVVTLDDSPVPDMLSSADRCDFTADGLAGIAQFALDAVAGSGGVVRRAESEAPAAAQVRRGWSNEPPPYLTQLRAVSSLRRELDALTAQVEPRLQIEKAQPNDRVIELQSIPHRLFARVGGTAISFSWVSGGLGTVADGRLLVMQWAGIDAHSRGTAALKVGSVIFERVYRAESTGPDDWRWRTDEPNGRACSTANLVAEWFAGASASMAT
jgi:hypothetical protein